MFEYEYRLHVGLNSFKDVKQCLLSLKPLIDKTITVKFMKNFRCKDNVWEIKRKLNRYAVYHLSHWFQFVESEEKPFDRWTREEYKLYHDLIVHYQYPLTIEHRYQIDLSNDAKVYGYMRNDKQFGLVFELEVKCSRRKIKNLPIGLDKLTEYKQVLFLFSKGFVLPYQLGTCDRKRVHHTREPIAGAFVAVKHDGVFGLVYSYSKYIFEMWEGNNSKFIPNETLGEGFVFAAEKLKDDTVILLDVYQVRGCKVLNLESVFFDFLPNLRLPPRYTAQMYHRDTLKVQIYDSSDGIIFHTANDKIYKLKPLKTLDLYYENGYFWVKDFKIPTRQSLTNGVVYECDLQLNVIKARFDRFVSNTPEQICEILPTLLNKSDAE